MWPFSRGKQPDQPISPEQADNTGANGPFEMTEELAEARVVPLAGVIDDSQASRVIQQLLFLAYDNPPRPIKIEIIDSPGGSVSATLAIVNTIEFLDSPIHTHCRLSAHGGAAIILACGAHGYRTVQANAVVSITEVWGATNDAEERQLEQDRLMLAAIMERHTSRPQAEWTLDFRYGHQLIAEKAVELGIADRIEP